MQEMSVGNLDVRAFSRPMIVGVSRTERPAETVRRRSTNPSVSTDVQVAGSGSES